MEINLSSFFTHISTIFNDKFEFVATILTGDRTGIITRALTIFDLQVAQFTFHHLIVLRFYVRIMFTYEKSSVMVYGV